MKLSDITIGLIKINTHISGHSSGSTSGHTIIVHRITGHTGHINHVVDYRELAKNRNTDRNHRNFNEYKLSTMILVNNVNTVLEPILVSSGYTKTNLKELELYNFMPVPSNLVNSYQKIIKPREDMNKFYKPLLELVKKQK